MNEYERKGVINLLENAVFFINQVPNRKYRTLDFHSSYDLASEIDVTIKKLKNGTNISKRSSNNE